MGVRAPRCRENGTRQVHWRMMGAPASISGGTVGDGSNAVIRVHRRPKVVTEPSTGATAVDGMVQPQISP